MDAINKLHWLLDILLFFLLAPNNPLVVWIYRTAVMNINCADGSVLFVQFKGSNIASDKA